MSFVLHDEKARTQPPKARRAGLLFALALVAGVAACHGEGAETLATCPKTQTLTYANFGQAFMQKYCLRCHSASVQGSARLGAPSDHNFDSLADIRSLAEHIDMNAGSGPGGTNTAMPEGDPTPTTDERAKLSEWLACGAP
jgi:uncharacterized membrane protein